MSVVLYDEGYYALDATDPRGNFFLQLGFTANPLSGSVSEEQLVQLDTDVLVVLGLSRAEFAQNAVAARLGAVTENRTVYVPTFAPDFAGALGFSGPLSLPFALEQAVLALAAATDRNPSTVPVDL